MVDKGLRRARHDVFAYDLALDDQLMARSADGDRRAFEEIVSRHHSFALRVASKIVTDRAVAEDVAQEALVRAWNRAHSFEASRAKFTTWLYRIVINLCIDQRRRKTWERLPDTYDPVDPSMTALELIEKSERHVALCDAIATLSERHRSVIALVYGEGLSNAETALNLGVTEKAVERLLARAMASLRDKLKTD